MRRDYHDGFARTVAQQQCSSIPNGITKSSDDDIATSTKKGILFEEVVYCVWMEKEPAHNHWKKVLADATRKETANARATTVGIAISYSKNIPTVELEWVWIGCVGLP
jgi:hypothetical protein